MGTNLRDKNLFIVPPGQNKYTVRDWEINNKMKVRVSEDQQKLADKVIRSVIYKNRFVALQQLTPNRWPFNISVKVNV